MSKGQISMEFIFVILVMITVFYLALQIKDNHDLQLQELTAEVTAKQLCHSFVSLIDKVYSGGDGIRTTITIPSKIDSSNYTIHFSPEKIISISYQETTIFCPFRANVIYNNTNSFDLEKGEHILHTHDGVVEIK